MRATAGGRVGSSFRRENPECVNIILSIGRGRHNQGSARFPPNVKAPARMAEEWDVPPRPLSGPMAVIKMRASPGHSADWHRSTVVIWWIGREDACHDHPVTQ